MKRRGQIFILAAMIITVIIIGLAGVTNYARIQEEPTDFYDYSEDVRSEAGAVIDYEIYTFTATDELEEFVRIMVENIRDKDSESSFMFIYGGEAGLIIENYGTDVASVATGVGVGNKVSHNLEPGNLNIESKISLGGSYLEVGEYYSYLGGTGVRADLSGSQLNGAKEIEVKILNNVYTFPITSDRQVIFIMQKEKEGETYVSA